MSRARDLANYISTGVTAAELDQLDTTGDAAGSGNFLRGDKTWVAAGGSSDASDLDSGTLATARMAAGSIVKTSSLTTGTSSTNIGTTNTTPVVTVVTATFTPDYDDSDVILHAMFGRSIYNTTTDVGLATFWERAISGGATTKPTNLSDHNSGSTYSNIYRGSATGSFFDHVSHTMLDSPATDSAITYTLYSAPYNVEVVGSYIGGGNNSRWWIFFQEVKR